MEHFKHLCLHYFKRLATYVSKKVISTATAKQQKRQQLWTFKDLACTEGKKRKEDGG